MTVIFNNIKNLKIAELENHQCNEMEVNYLLEVFITTVERLAPTLAREELGLR